ncbi:MAG TPA: GNAT family N-acetyltransferase [Candidatus Acidoferrum sp.]|nr:GNAT family N-acetyltransferase [Candidatus Acidoferrum sp.]
MTRGTSSIQLEVPGHAVWALLVGPDRRDWYYRLTPRGEFADGAHITWVDAEDQPVEESDVVAIELQRRLVLRTRFVFAPGLAAAAPHVVTWELTGEGDRCEARMSWEAEGPAASMLASDASSQLDGLRLAADPAARAELARLDRIGEIKVRDVSPEQLPAYLDFFDHRAFLDFPEWRSCYCIETHRAANLSDDEWAQPVAEANRRDMSESIMRGEVTALLAFEGDTPIGWCDYGETTRLSGVMHKFGLTAADHEGVGSVACFVIASPYRGHGVASRLLDAAVERLRAKGLNAVEAYPTRSGDSQHTNYRGPLAMFLRAGFEPYREAGRHLILRKRLA